MRRGHPLNQTLSPARCQRTMRLSSNSEVMAKTPEQAATIARDIMLDPDSEFPVDVHKIVYVEDADDWMCLIMTRACKCDLAASTTSISPAG